MSSNGKREHQSLRWLVLAALLVHLLSSPANVSSQIHSHASVSRNVTGLPESSSTPPRRSTPRQQHTPSSQYRNSRNVSSFPNQRSTPSGLFSPICQTAGCVEVQEMFKGSINQSIDPCVDFSEYVCGRWREDHPRNDEYHISLWDSLESVIINITADSLDTISENSTRLPPVFHQAQLFYHQCMNDSMNSPNVSTITDILKYMRTLASWPLIELDNWQPSQFDTASVVGKLWRELGLSTLIDLSIDVDLKKPTRNNLYIQQASLEQPIPKFTNRSLYFYFVPVEYKFVMNRTIVNLLWNVSRQNWSVGEIELVVKEIIDLESNIANQLVPERDQIYPETMYNPDTLKGIKLKYNSDHFKWDNYFGHVLDPKAFTWLKSKDGQLIVTEPKFLRYLMQLLNDTPKDVVANYLFWRLLVRLAPFMGVGFEEAAAYVKAMKHSKTGIRNSAAQEEASSIEAASAALQAAYNSETEDTEQEDEVELAEKQRKRCVTDVIKYFQPVTDFLLTRKHWTSLLQTHATKLAKEIKSAIIQMFRQNRWMSQFSKSRAISKIEAMAQNIGHPAWLKNLSRIQQPYDTLHFDTTTSSQSYFKSFVAVSRYFQQLELEKLFLKPDVSDFTVPLTTVNAEYVPWLNSINVPVAQVMKPNFDPNFPNFYNYAITGFTIGHEMFHAFDDYGSLFDKDGVLKSSWMMDKQTLKIFKRQSRCLIDNYEDLCFDLQTESDLCDSCTRNSTVCINGTLTVAENIADIFGLKAAYRAYISFLGSKNGSLEEQSRLYEFENFKPAQLFFIAYGYGWCSSLSDDALRDLLADDGHCPESVRINEVLRNIPEFSAAFGCRRGQAMYAERACELW